MIDRRTLLGTPLLPFLPPAQELPVDAVQRLSEELAVALQGWADGQFMARVYPMHDQRGVLYVSRRPQNIMRAAAQEFALSAMQLEACTMRAQLLEAVDDKESLRFQLNIHRLNR